MKNNACRFGLALLAVCLLVSCRKYYTQYEAPIPDNPEESLVVKLDVDEPRVMEIQDLDIEIWFEHPDLADLEAWLESPLGTVVPLFDNISELDLRVIFDDEADAPIRPGNSEKVWSLAVYECQIQYYNPHSLGLFLYDGEDPNGEWRLHVRDREPGDSGMVTLFSLRINGEW